MVIDIRVIERSSLKSAKEISFIHPQYPKTDHNSNCSLLTPSICSRNITTAGAIVVEDLDTEVRQNFGLRERRSRGLNEILRELLLKKMLIFMQAQDLRAGLNLPTMRSSISELNFLRMYSSLNRERNEKYLSCSAAL